MKSDPLNSHQPSLHLRDALVKSASSGRAWSDSFHDGMKRLLKDYLFDLQSSRCFYCRCDIKDVAGHVEIDHILPKSSRGNPALWTSSDRTCRRRTGGYPQYEFSLHNLVLSCKRCNNRKGSYDSRSIRAHAAPTFYNLDSSFFEWIHPYLDVYSNHISRLEGLIYQLINSSRKGGAVINACRLDKIEAAERAARNRRIKRNKGFKEAIEDSLGDVCAIGWGGVADLVVHQFPDDEVAIRSIVGEMQNRLERA